jgi:hypothetical protein
MSVHRGHYSMPKAAFQYRTTSYTTPPRIRHHLVYDTTSCTTPPRVRSIAGSDLYGQAGWMMAAGHGKWAMGTCSCPWHSIKVLIPAILVLLIFLEVVA